MDFLEALMKVDVKNYFAEPLPYNDSFELKDELLFKQCHFAGILEVQGIKISSLL